MFSCEFCEIFKKNYFEEHQQIATSGHSSALHTFLTGKSHETREFFFIDKWDLGIIPLKQY